MQTVTEEPERPADTQGLRVLVVENDPDAAECLVHELRRHGHAARSAGTGGLALQLLPSVDLVLLDLDLPDLDGLEVCRRLRAEGDTPIIIVTARGTELDRVLGLQAGSDDYVVKPYGLRELLARIDAVMRRAQPSAPPPARVITHGTLRIDARSREIALGGRPIPLTPKEFDLLHLLASQPGTTLSRRQLLRQVWDDEWSHQGRTIDTHVSSLRSKLGSGSWIVTVRGVGFRIGDAR
ncbi:response regulator transcription factor [Streptacidiphilus neutrinimicus]|uniref:response regulator transcription factor n=1 Tax=Streptacidiphilus neutrinimicus TaxID=105420 RepID=UPI0005AB03DA|nr:response regulator transcription factor [Streptacidiphilus neutrinimicus]